MRKRPRNLVGLLQQTGGKLGERAAEFSVPALLAATAHERSPRAGSPGAEAPSALDPSKTLPAGFSVSIAFGVDRSVLTLRGELDLFTEAAFGGFLEVAVTWPGRLVVLDLAELAFIDARGLDQLAGVLPRLRKDGRVLVVVSPSPMVYELLDLTGLTADVQVELPLPRITRAWPRGPQPVDTAGSGALAGRSR